MQGFLSQSRGRRFLKKFGMALLWAAVVGSALAPEVLLPGPGLHRLPYVPLERAERALYDWRLGERALQAERSAELVMVALDAETLAHARDSDAPELAAQPWPREVLGQLVRQLYLEGARAVLVDLPLQDLSPRAPLEDVARDDLRLFEHLQAAPGPTVLGFHADPEPPPSLGRQLRPLRLRVVDVGSEREALPHLRRILAARHPALLRREGERLSAWAVVSTEKEGEALARALGVGGKPVLVEISGDDRAAEWRAEDVLSLLASVQVTGVDVERLPRVRSLQGPVAPLLGAPLSFGLSELPVDPDGRVRSVHHLVRYAPADGPARVLPSFALAGALALAGTRQVRVEGGVLRAGELAIPVGPAGDALLAFDAPESARDARGTLKRTVSAWRVAENARDRQRGVPPHYDNGLDGKVVVLTQPGTAPPLRTPVGEVRSAAALQGQALANMLHGNGTVRPLPGEELSWLYLMAFLGAFVGLTFAALVRSGPGAVVYLGLVGAVLSGWLLFTRAVFVHEHAWLRAAGPALAFVGTVVLSTLYAIRTDQQVGAFVTGVLGRYVSPEVARQVTKDLSLVRPERRRLTVCFVDIDGFGALAAEMPPDKLAVLLREFLSTTTEVIRRSAGQVDKYVGDAVMAFWGAPVRTEDHARVACQTVGAIRAALQARQADWEKRLGHRLPFRVGINTGEVVVGDLGSGLKSQYTVLGAAVNGAAALERLNRKLGTTVLVGHETAEAAGGDFIFREVAILKPASGGEPLRAMELLGPVSELDDAARAWLETYHAGYTHLQEGRRAEALAAFRSIESMDPVARYHVQRLGAGGSGGLAGTGTEG